MDSKEIFSAALRVIGLLSVGRGLSDLLYFFVIYFEFEKQSVTRELPYMELFLGLFYLFAGLYFLRGAPLILAYAFPEKVTKIEQENQNNIENIEN
ncbi:MAG TPA: hypothetical protein VNB22_19815 [Pyrinomonadaceae bacterium]|nr:hypothetical protein [Pyrinomonadaceae bacterium]